MFCKNCNTRLSPGERTCPNCGNDAGPEAAISRPSRPTPLPSPRLSTAKEPDDELELELELNEVTGELPIEPEPAAKPEAAPATTPSAKPEAAPATTPAPARKPTGSAPLFAPDPAGLRALLTEQPEALEEGLGVFRNDDGTPVGAQYSTAVGDIDLLATDTRGNLVVVMISEKGQGEELVGEVLQRVGWIRKHLGEDGKKVRGIVLCEEPPESLSYAAAAVADTIAFKTYRVALTFEDLDI
jgi:hypothetical protein